MLIEAMPSEEEWSDWLQHPCTKRLRFWAEKDRLGLMEMWAKGNFSAAFDTEMAVKNAGATGACSVYADVIELNYDLIVIGASDEPGSQQLVGPDPIGASSAS